MLEKSLRKPSKKITKILADNIRSYRAIHNISQEKLADMCELHRTYIGSIERGERNVTLSTLEVLSKILNISIPQLLSERKLENE